jgi:hypothetical protein
MAINSPAGEYNITASAIVFSNGGSMGMMLKELIRSYGIKLTQMVDSVEQLVAAIRLGEADLAVIDDSVELPSMVILRRLMGDPVAFLTPKLVFLGEPHAQTEREIFSKLSGVEFLTKPLTPVKFHPVMRNLSKVIRNEPWTHLRTISKLFIAGQADVATKALSKLTASPVVGDMAVQALAIFLVKSGDLKAAERLLLGLMRKNPTNATTLLLMIDLYYQAAMPKLGTRIASGLHAANISSILPIMELAQGHALAGNLEELEQALLKLLATGSMPDVTKLQLFRLLMAEGRVDEATRHAPGSKAKEYLEAVEKVWAEPSDASSLEGFMGSQGAPFAPGAR